MIAYITGLEFLVNGMVIFAGAEITRGLAVTELELAMTHSWYGIGAILMLYSHSWSSERIGHRRLFQAAALVFVVGSVVCGSADDLTTYAIGRFLQGVGGATFFLTGRMVLNETAPQLQPFGLRFFVAGLLGGAAIAPLLATLLLSVLGWRAIHFCGLIFVIGVGLFGSLHLEDRLLPVQQRSSVRLGWALWFAACIGTFQCALYYGILSHSHPYLSLSAIFAAVLCLAVFVTVQWHRRAPPIDFRRLADRRYLRGLALYSLGYLMLGVTSFLLPALMQTALRFSTLSIAIAMSCAMTLSLLVALLQVRFAANVEQRICLLLGLILWCAGSMVVAGAIMTSVLSLLWVGIFLIYIGMPVFLGTVAKTTFVGMQGIAFVHGYQLKNIVRQIGLSVGFIFVPVLVHTVSSLNSTLGTHADIVQTVVAFAGNGVHTPTLVAYQSACLLLSSIAALAMVVSKFQRA